MGWLDGDFLFDRIWLLRDFLRLEEDLVDLLLGQLNAVLKDVLSLSKPLEALGMHSLPGMVYQFSAGGKKHYNPLI